MQFQNLRLALPAIAACILALSAGQAGAFSEIVVFGDSLSDNGNVYQLTQDHPSNPQLPFPGDDLYVGGRQSNGRVGVEFMALNLGTPLTNYAQVGATTGTVNVWDGFLGEPQGALGLSGMLTQVQTYISQSPSSDPNNLYVLWGGPNDFLSGLANPRSFDAGAAISGALTNLSNEAVMLYGDGARSFLIPNMPDLGLTPRASSLGVSALATGLSFSFNANLIDVLTGLRNLPGATIYGYDAFRRSQEIFADFSWGDPAAPEVSDACYLDAVCATDPQMQSQYFFWDDVHPTTQVHSILGREMAAAVPEPETWVLVMAGLALVFWKRRRILS